MYVTESVCLMERKWTHVEKKKNELEKSSAEGRERQKVQRDKGKGSVCIMVRRRWRRECDGGKMEGRKGSSSQPPSIPCQNLTHNVPNLLPLLLLLLLLLPSSRLAEGGRGGAAGGNGGGGGESKYIDRRGEAET